MSSNTVSWISEILQQLRCVSQANGGKHLLRLINQVLDLSKIEAGRMELQLEPVSLRKMIESARHIIHPLTIKKRIECSVEVEHGMGAVLADAARVEQVLLNLLSNAVKFTPEGGRIWMRAARDNGTALVELGDTGPGIPESERKKIFVEFHQIATGRSPTTREGTGRGLALARRFVELHGGKL